MLIDFDFSCVVPEDAGVHERRNGWTWPYTAPERAAPDVPAEEWDERTSILPFSIIHPATLESDVFSFGVLMNIVCTPALRLARC
jgi:hypothetical protein